LRYIRIASYDATTVTTEDGQTFKIADDAQLRKLDDGVLHYVAINQFGVVMLTDRPEGSMFSDVRKRDEPTFAEAHSRLAGNFLTPSVGIAKGAGIDPDVDRAARAVSMVKVATDSRRLRNLRVRRCVQRAANSEYETEAGAARALRRALQAEFKKVELDQMGIKY
jgi:hypothetical protein